VTPAGVSREDDDAEEARRFAVSFRESLDWVRTFVPDDAVNEVVAFVRDFLGEEAAKQSVVARELTPFEQVNVQTALNAWSAHEDRTVVIQGIALPPHFGQISLQQLVSGDGLPPLRLSAPSLVDLANGPGSTLACLQLAVLLVTDRVGRYVLLVTGPSQHEPQLRLEAVGLPVAAAQAVLAELDSLRLRLNVYRGRLLDVSSTPMGGVALSFADIPATPREDVVLPEPVLQRIERHALGVAAHRRALIEIGQHLKRGLLLFGPPGTGKTHTMRYLVAHMPGYTRLLMSGRSLYLIGSITELARQLEPAVIVLEDVDLVAEDRSFGPGGTAILFDLLDAMDGAAPDADLLFLLTTNRADLLEPALAARPGRVDVAVEIALPEAEARRRLLHLYARRVPLQLNEEDESAVIEHTEGVTASFLKELVRRAALEALRDDAAITAVTGQHLARALDDLLDSAQGVTRTLLGVGIDRTDLAGTVGAQPAPGLVRHGWVGPRPRGIAISRSHYP
jgi:DNA polymerase III delta prime subunit